MKKTIALLLAVIMVFSMVACAAKETPAAPEKEETPAAPEKEETSVEGTEAPAEEDPIVVGMIMQDVIGQMGSDMRAAAYYMADQLGAEIKFVDGQSKLETQVNGIDSLLASGELDSIIIWPCDDKGISQSVKACNDAGVPVITVDVTSAEGEVQCHVASDNMEIGRIDGRFAVETLVERNGSESGKIIVCGFPSLNSMRERVAGFLEIVEEYPDIEIIEHDFSANTFEAGQQLTDDLMQLYPEGSFDILYGANCAPGLGGLNSAEINGRTDFDVITVDNIEQFITACEKGVGATVLKGFVSQDPIDMGMTAMELAVAAAKGEDTGEYLHATAISLVTPENVDDFMSNYQKMSDMIASFR